MLLDFLDSCVTLNVWTPPASATFFIVCINHRRLPNVIYICDTHYMLSCPGLISFESQQQHRWHFWDVPCFFFSSHFDQGFFLLLLKFGCTPLNFSRDASQLFFVVPVFYFFFSCPRGRSTSVFTYEDETHCGEDPNLRP